MENMWKIAYDFFGQSLPGFAVASLLLLVLGFKMNSYWSNGILVIAWLVLSISVYLMKSLHGLEQIPRLLITGASSACLGLILYYALWTVIIEAPLNPWLTYSPTARENGDMYGGIRWIPVFREVRLSLFNATAVDYQDLDLLITPDSPVAEMRKLSEGDLTIWREQVPPHKFDEFTHDGQRISFDLVPFLTDGGYRIKTTTFPAHSSIDLVIALANAHILKPFNIHNPDAVITMTMNDKITGEESHMWFAGRQHTDSVYELATTPKSIKIEGRFTCQIERKVSIAMPIQDEAGNFAHGIYGR